MSATAENVQQMIPRSVSVRQPNVVEMTEQSSRFLEAANQISITCGATLQSAASYLLENKEEQKRLENERREMVDPLNDVVKKINAKYKPVMEVLQRAETIIRGRIGSYQQEQERLRREEIAKAEERARREREKLEARALAAAEKGQTERAADLEMRAATTVAVAPVMEQPKIHGASTRFTWKATVTDPVALCRAIANGELPPTLVDFKPIELNRIASTWQDNRQFDGLRITKEPVVSARG